MIMILATVPMGTHAAFRAPVFFAALVVLIFWLIHIVVAACARRRLQCFKTRILAFVKHV